MPTIRTLDAVKAHHVLRQLTMPNPERAPGTPAPSFDALYTAAELVARLGTVATRYEAQYGLLQSAHAVHENGVYVPIRDATGGEVEGKWKVDLPAMNAGLIAAQQALVEVAFTPMTRTELYALVGDAVTVDLTALMPIMAGAPAPEPFVPTGPAGTV